MPRKVQTPEDKEKMLQRLAEGRKKIQENREKKQKEFEEKGGEEEPAKVFEKKEIKPAPIKIEKTPAPKKIVTEEKLDKIANQLEELTSYKREKIELKKKKAEDDIRIKKETEENDLKNKLQRLAQLEEKEKQKSGSVPKPTTAVASSSIPEIIFPRSYNHRFLQGGRF